MKVNRTVLHVFSRFIYIYHEVIVLLDIYGNWAVAQSTSLFYLFQFVFKMSNILYSIFTMSIGFMSKWELCMCVKYTCKVWIIENVRLLQGYFCHLRTSVFYQNLEKINKTERQKIPNEYSHI